VSTLRTSVTDPVPRYERDLVAAFCAVLAKKSGVLGIQDYTLEFDYERGRTDIVGVSAKGEVIAVEAKLRDWREALHQAYRNTCFAIQSYVLLPLATARKAAAHSQEFDDLRVGICTIMAGHVVVLHPAPHHNEPLEPQLHDQALAFVAAAANVA